MHRTRPALPKSWSQDLYRDVLASARRPSAWKVPPREEVEIDSSNQDSHHSDKPNDAFMDALYREHAGPLHAYVLRLVGGDRHQAEDVVQETFVRAWRQADQWDPAARTVRPWLVTVARRIVIDGYRSRQARPQEVDSSSLQFIPVEDEIEKTLSIMVISDALSDLSHAHREVLVETYLKGRTVNEAAERLGIPSGTVRSRIFYGLRSMKLALEQRGAKP
jgi:RNA polymerase sigma-70 factor (ECF subfamily)